MSYYDDWVEGTEGGGRPNYLTPERPPRRRQAPQPRTQTLSKEEFLVTFVAGLGLRPEPCQCGKAACLGWRMVGIDH
jgi:hypothetical protein